MLPVNITCIESKCETQTLKQPHMSSVHFTLQHLLCNIKALLYCISKYQFNVKMLYQEQKGHILKSCSKSYS